MDLRENNTGTLRYLQKLVFTHFLIGFLLMSVLALPIMSPNILYHLIMPNYPSIQYFIELRNMLITFNVCI